jgi:hypothetical protein
MSVLKTWRARCYVMIDFLHYVQYGLPSPTPPKRKESSRKLFRGSLRRLMSLSAAIEGSRWLAWLYHPSVNPSRRLWNLSWPTLKYSIVGSLNSNEHWYYDAMRVLFGLTPNVSAEVVTPTLPENLQYVWFFEAPWNPTCPTSHGIGHQYCSSGNWWDHYLTPTPARWSDNRSMRGIMILPDDWTVSSETD